MSADRTVTAAEGKIMFGYYTAGLLRSCTVSRVDGLWTLIGTLADGNANWLSRQPLVFKVTHQHGCWTWPLLELPQIAEGTLTARLGPPELPDGHHRQAEDRQAVTQ